MPRGSSDDGPAEEPGDQNTHGDHGRVTCRLARRLAKLRPRAHAAIEIRLKFSRPAPTVPSTTPSRSHRHAQRWAVAEQAAPEVVGEERRGQPAHRRASWWPSGRRSRSRRKPVANGSARRTARPRTNAASSAVAHFVRCARSARDRRAGRGRAGPRRARSRRPCALKKTPQKNASHRVTSRTAALFSCVRSCSRPASS